MKNLHLNATGKTPASPVKTWLAAHLPMDYANQLPANRTLARKLVQAAARPTNGQSPRAKR
jgi:hypothetical protein